jgi:hypothetical protein
LNRHAVSSSAALFANLIKEKRNGNCKESPGEEIRAGQEGSGQESRSDQGRGQEGSGQKGRSQEGASEEGATGQEGGSEEVGTGQEGGTGEEGGSEEGCPGEEGRAFQEGGTGQEGGSSCEEGRRQGACQEGCGQEGGSQESTRSFTCPCGLARSGTGSQASSTGCKDFSESSGGMAVSNGQQTLSGQTNVRTRLRPGFFLRPALTGSTVAASFRRISGFPLAPEPRPTNR